MSYIKQLEEQNEDLKQLLARREEMCCQWVERGGTLFLTPGKKTEFRVAEIKRIYVYQPSPAIGHAKIMWTATIYSGYHPTKTDPYESKEKAMAAVEKRVFGE